MLIIAPKRRESETDRESEEKWVRIRRVLVKRGHRREGCPPQLYDIFYLRVKERGTSNLVVCAKIKGLGSHGFILTREFNQALFFFFCPFLWCS